MSDAKQLPQTGRAMPVVACDLPVTLHLELARFSIPLKTLAELAPGDVLDARTPIGQEVTLRAGDVAVAVGELVDFEGDIGVRITRVHLAEAEGPAVE